MQIIMSDVLSAPSRPGATIARQGSHLGTFRMRRHAASKDIIENGVTMTAREDCIGRVNCIVLDELGALDRNLSPKAVARQQAVFNSYSI